MHLSNVSAVMLQFYTKIFDSCYCVDELFTEITARLWLPGAVIKAPWKCVTPEVHVEVNKLMIIKHLTNSMNIGLYILQVTKHGSIALINWIQN